jgi:toxin HigB-1
VIQSFKDDDTEKLWKDERVPAFQQIEAVGRRKLQMLNAATTLTDLKVPPNNKLEKLEKDRKGQHSIRISDKWRICFVWKDGHAYDVEITDYH